MKFHKSPFFLAAAVLLVGCNKSEPPSPESSMSTSQSKIKSAPVVIPAEETNAPALVPVRAQLNSTIEVTRPPAQGTQLLLEKAVALVESRKYPEAADLLQELERKSPNAEQSKAIAVLKEWIQRDTAKLTNLSTNRAQPPKN